MFAIFSVLLITLAGGAIDISTAYANKSRFQDLSDRVALAAAKGSDISEMKDLGEAMLQEYIDRDPHMLTVTDFEIKPTLVDGVKTVVVNLAAKPDTHFLHIIGMDMLPIKASSTASEQRSNVEVSLVLDISFSMAGTKVKNLKTASNEFVDAMIGPENTSDTTSITIVPFGGNVNLGTDLAEKFMPTLSQANKDPSDNDYRNAVSAGSSNLASKLYRFSDGTNCVETTFADYNTDMIAENSRSQLPSFVHKNTGLSICPDDASSVLFNSNNKATLKNKIKGLVLSHGTGMDAGALWGLKSLSPSFRGYIGGNFTDRPHDYSGKSEKVLVIMTDGNITGQGRTKKPNSIARLKKGGQNPGNQKLYLPGTWQSSSSDDNAVGRFKKTCEIAKTNDIEIYTIGYKIKKGEIADKLLNECATSPSNYFFVEKNDIKSAFEKIAADITDLHITQ